MDVKLFLKGIKCFTNCLIDKAKTSPGKKFSAPGTKTSDYGKHLKEKQMTRFMAQINEAQFKRLFNMASKERGKTGETLLRLLELRLDNIVRRIGFSVSLKTARQIVCHNHVKVNGKNVNIPSYILKPGDTISMDPKIAQTFAVKQGLENIEKGSLRPSFLSYDAQTLSGKILRLPDKTEFSIPANEQLLVEFYSK
jgi:small subunit ribosomal protein S4